MIRNILKTGLPFTWLVLFLFVGCGPTFQQVRPVVDEAKEYQEAVKRTGITENISADVAVSQKNYADAEQSCTNRDYRSAVYYAQESITASKRVLLQGISRSVTAMKEEIQRKQEENPATPLKKLIPKLDEILQFANRIQADNQELENLSLVKAASISSDLRLYEEDIKSSQQEKLHSDISFALGKFELANEGKIALDKFADKIVSIIDENLRLFPDKPILLQIDVYGYTDSSGFLSDGGNRQKRILLNQRLSELRAKSVSNYLNQSLSSRMKPYLQKVSIQPGKIIGKGEEVPAGVAPSSLVNNPQRRICQIFSTAVHDIIK
jgi:outer membrane protein OmpA-like peptidoglycan-associated protein